MLHGSFYSTQDLRMREGHLECRVIWEAGHPIFSGHFPNHPVVPGVCMMQVVKEVWELATGQEAALVRVDAAKFLRLIDPSVTPRLDLRLDYFTVPGGGMQWNGSLQEGDSVFFKYKAEIRISSPSHALPS